MPTPYTSIFLFFFFFLLIPPPPRSTLFPYTTLFRSVLYCPSFSEEILKQNAARPECDGPDVLAWFPVKFYYSRSEEHTSELQSRRDLVCRLLLEKKKKKKKDKK